MSGRKSLKDYLYRPTNDIAEQVDAVPFLGDLYSFVDEEFFPVEKKTLLVKSLSVTEDRFVGEVILADVDWSKAPRKYDRVVVGVEIAIPRPGKKSLPGSWILSNCNGERRDISEFNVDVSPGDIRVTFYNFQLLKRIKSEPPTSQNIRCECSFDGNLKEIADSMEDTKRTTEDILPQSTYQQLKNHLENTGELTAEMNYLVLDWIRNLISDNWACLTYFLIKQFEKVQDYVKFSNNEITRIQEMHKEKRDLIESFKTESIEYVYTEETWLRINDEFTEVFALTFRCDLLLENYEVFTFFSDLKGKNNGKNSIFCVVDMDLVEDSVFETSPPALFQIQKYVKAKCEIADVMANQGFTKYNLAINSGEWQKVAPERRTLLKSFCPGNCDGGIREWLCGNCKLPLYYAFEWGIFCDLCGAGEVRDFWYRCSDIKHSSPIPSTVEQNRNLNALLPMPEINILVLGPSGVGKSTWINAACNYMSFKTLEKAEMYEAKTPIPLKSVTGENEMRQKTVFVGEVAGLNENKSSATSATQDCQKCSVVLDDVVFNLIDTPGLRRGIKEDRENWEKILDFARSIEEIHGICIVIEEDKKKSARHYYWLEEVLNNLHINARGNIILCYRSDQYSFLENRTPLPSSILEIIGVRDCSRVNKYLYKPTKPKFHKKLSNEKRASWKVDRVSLQTSSSDLEDRMFYMDNRAYNYLCCRRFQNSYDSDCTEDERFCFLEIWVESASETTFLLRKVRTFAPHRIGETLSINRARLIIRSLAKPIADITRAVEASLRELQTKQADAERAKMTVDQILANNRIITYRMKSVPLSHPRTVCVADRCVDKMPLGTCGMTQTLYRQHCHPECYCVQNIEPETRPNPNLKSCVMMNTSYFSCNHCGCSWENHKRIYFEQIAEEVVEEGEVDMNRLQEARAEADSKQLIVDDFMKVKKDREDEKEQIIQIVGYLNNFLKENALASFSDPYSTTGGRSYRIGRVVERGIFGVGLRHTNAIIMTADDLEKYEKQLFDLPIYGGQLRAAIEVAMKTEK